ncbi:unnamed protein product [Nesidiocoris tenuis]|uniref:Uncharacterized protein n=1 Tax=Nesidiocoris tenuis TaxID=355587 RepID=A0A6H5HI48_9HEMI|nr:unnamed protein product [Nesidiocoris tenuis]
MVLRNQNTGPPSLITDRLNLFPHRSLRTAHRARKMGRQGRSTDPLNPLTRNTGLPSKTTAHQRTRSIVRAIRSPSVHRTDEAKNAIGNFGNLPLSDSVYESSNQQDVRKSSSTEHSPLSSAQSNNNSHEISITKSVPIGEYLSSIEYPMQIVQTPILDVPELPKYFDLGYHNFHQQNYQHNRQQAVPDSERSPSINRPLYAYNIFHQQNTPVVRVPAPQQTADFMVSMGTTANSGPTEPTAPSPSSPPRQFFNTQPSQNTTGVAPAPTNWVTTSTSWGTPPRPFDPPLTTTEAAKKTKQIHQIIVPYTTLRRPLQARKVPSEPTSMPDLQAIYVNRGVTAPAESTISNVNYALTATGSEQHDIHVPDQELMLSSLPPEVLNKLLEIGINPEKDPKGSLQQILAATNLKSLLHGEEDSVDLVRLVKNIDKWTAEDYGKRVTIPQTNSKQIPDEYFTTPALTEETPHETHTPPTDHEAAASQHYHVSYKVSHDSTIPIYDLILQYTVD